MVKIRALYEEVSNCEARKKFIQAQKMLGGN